MFIVNHFVIRSPASSVWLYYGTNYPC